MNTDRAKWLLAVLVSAALLTALALLADLSLPDIENFNARWIAFMLAAHLAMVCCRGLLMRALANEQDHNGAAQWIRLAARHQAIFSVLPSGVGDLSFPLLAKRFVSLEAGKAMRVIILIRQRDVIVLATISMAGAALLLDNLLLALTSGIVGAVALWFAGETAELAARVLGLVFRKGKLANWVRGFAIGQGGSCRGRATGWLLTAQAWTASTLAVLCAFAAIGEPLTIGGALLFIALVNLAGLVAVSVAGLGVSEAGAAGALVLVGRSSERAAATALIIRPTLMVSLVASSLLLDLFLGLRVRKEAA